MLSVIAAATILLVVSIIPPGRQVPSWQGVCSDVTFEVFVPANKAARVLTIAIKDDTDEVVSLSEMPTAIDTFTSVKRTTRMFAGDTIKVEAVVTGEREKVLGTAFATMRCV